MQAPVHATNSRALLSVTIIAFIGCHCVHRLVRIQHPLLLSRKPSKPFFSKQNLLATDLQDLVGMDCKADEAEGTTVNKWQQPFGQFDPFMCGPSLSEKGATAQSI